ncbi:MAG: efflux RND transporter periplasmic adaptor subunit [Psychrobium sp.]
MIKFFIALVFLAVGIVISPHFLFLFNAHDVAMSETTDEKKPLYWVAPMDANFRRDEPGLSPMGMELVPVYEEDESSDVGVVRLSSALTQNLGVKTAKVLQAPLIRTIEATGLVEYSQELMLDVNPRVSGWIENIYVKEVGDPVVKGQPLYDIYSPELVNAQEEYLLALSQSNQRLIKAAHKRLAYLLMPEKAIAQLAKTRQVMRYYTVKSTIDGVVQIMDIRAGSHVTPHEKLLRLVSLDEVWLRLDVLESQANLMAVGDEVNVSVRAYAEREWTGTIDKFYPMLDGMNRTAQVRVRIDNSEGLLRPNMLAFSTIEKAAESDSLLVPNNALIRTGHSNRVVLALGEGRYKSVEVTLGRHNRQYREILSGVNADDSVVTSAQFLIDSESNVASDMARHTLARENVLSEKSSLMWVKAVVNRVMEVHEMVNVTHEPIAQWDWPEMRMNFYLAESINVADFSVGQQLEIAIVKDEEGDYVIVEFKEVNSEQHHMHHNMHPKKNSSNEHQLNDMDVMLSAEEKMMEHHQHD